MVQYRPTESRDVPEAAAMAARILSGSLVAQLGPGFLRSFHMAALEQAETIALGAFDGNGQPLGFALATSDIHAFNSRIRRRVLVPLARALLPPRRWQLIPKFARSLFETEPEPDIPAELLFLYVDPTVHRGGVGSGLIEHLDAELRSRCVDRYRVAVRSHLEAARAFYDSTGFVLEQEITVLGESMTYFTRALRQE
jgi:ribosomal protein S18 acetylase RimI-like enzyme